MSSSGSEGDLRSIGRIGEKRPFNGEVAGNCRSDYPPAKRSTLSTDDKEETFVKCLIPNFVSGMIIGSAGAKVTKIMDDTHTVIKFSPGRELYPGTTDRVCIIFGSIPNICAAVRCIHETMSQSTHLRAEEIQDLMKHFKMVISNIASGMVIGKSGLTVKSIQSNCGVKIQISNKEENGLPERMLTISGETEAIVKSVERILEHTIDDPDGNKWKRMISYSGYTASPPSVVSKSKRSSNSIGGTTGSHTPPNSSGFPVAPQHSNAIGQPGNASAAAAAAMSYGASSNMSDPTSAFLSLLQQQHHQQQAYSAYGASAGSASAQNNSGGNMLNQALLSYAYSQSLMSTSSYYGQINPMMVDGVNLTVPGATLSTYEVAVPEVMVSSIVGAGGKLMADLIRTTGARIQLSGKGEYIPGTYNRKLTIAGPILSVQAAHMIVMQKILKEQDAYQKQGLI